MSKNMRFMLQVGFSVNVGGINGNVPEPGTDCVDIDTRAKKVRSRRVPDGVRTDTLAQQRLMPDGRFHNISPQHRVYPVPCDRLAAMIKENRLIWRTVLSKKSKFFCRCRP